MNTLRNTIAIYILLAGLAPWSCLAGDEPVSAAPNIIIKDIRVISPDLSSYSGWGTVVRRKSTGELMLAYSGGRDDHVCPFGRVEQMVSHDDGVTWSWPRVLMDSATDDRDTGMLETAKGTILVTFFTSIAYQKHLANPKTRIDRIFGKDAPSHIARWNLAKMRLTPEQEKADVGHWMLRSTDGGLTWSERLPMPCFSPHGPTEMADGTLMFAGANGKKAGVWISKDDGLTWELLSELDVRPGETHGLEAADGTLVVQVRDRVKLTPAGKVEWAIVQMDSHDRGKTWTRPRVITDGFPSFLTKLANGDLLMTYGYRKVSYGIRARLSKDNGQSWSEEIVITSDGPSSDLGYPSTVVFPDGSFLTVWYEVMSGSRNAVMRQARWSIK